MLLASFLSSKGSEKESNMFDKKYRSTIAIVIIFFGLLAFVFFFEKDKEGRVDVEEKIGSQEEIDVVEFPESDVEKIEIKNVSGVLNLEKKDGKWVLLGDDATDVNELQVTTLLKGFNELQASGKFAVSDVSEFGLQNPPTEFSLTTVTGDTYSISFGKLTLGEYNVYIQINHEGDVFIVPITFLEKITNITKESFNKEVDTANETVESE